MVSAERETYKDVSANVALNRGKGRGLEVVENEDQGLASLDEFLGGDLVLGVNWNVGEGFLERRVLEVRDGCVGHAGDGWSWFEVGLDWWFGGLWEELMEKRR